MKKLGIKIGWVMVWMAAWMLFAAPSTITKRLIEKEDFDLTQDDNAASETTQVTTSTGGTMTMTRPHGGMFPWNNAYDRIIRPADVVSRGPIYDLRACTTIDLTDSATDDLPCINAARDALPNGGTIYAPKGTYNLGHIDGVRLSSYITIVGDGPGTIFKVKSPEGMAFHTAYTDNAQTPRTSANPIVGVRLANFKIDGTCSAPVAHSTFGIWLKWTSNFVIENLVIDNTEGTGIQVGDGVHDGWIRNNTLTRVGKLGGNMPGGIITFSNSADTAEEIYNLAVVGNHIDNTGQNNIQFRNTRDSIIVGNICSNSADEGIEAGSPNTETETKNILIANNTVKNFVDHGIFLRGAKHSMIVGNIVSGGDKQGATANETGIGIGSDGVGYNNYMNTITGNIIFNNLGHGIRDYNANIYDSGAGVTQFSTITGNQIDNNALNGIYSISTMANISGNYIMRNKGSGIVSLHASNITGNSIYDNGKNADGTTYASSGTIDLSSGTTAVVSGNVVTLTKTGIGSTLAVGVTVKVTGGNPSNINTSQTGIVTASNTDNVSYTYGGSNLASTPVTAGTITYNSIFGIDAQTMMGAISGNTIQQLSLDTDNLGANKGIRLTTGFGTVVGNVGRYLAYPDVIFNANTPLKYTYKIIGNYNMKDLGLSSSGISDATRTANHTGTATFDNTYVSGTGYAQVFQNAEENANYTIMVTVDKATYVYYSNRSTTGFNLHVANTAVCVPSCIISWQLIR